MAFRWPFGRNRSSAGGGAVATTSVSDAGPRGSRDSIVGLMSRGYAGGLVNPLAGLGGPHDRNATSYYGPVIPINQVDLDNQYRGSWIPRKIVDLRAEDMTRAWITRTWKDKDNDTVGARALDDEESRIGGRAAWTDGVRWGGLFGGAGLILGIRGQKLYDPIELDKIGKGDLEWIAVRDRWFLVPSGGWINIPGPLLGYPNAYNIVNAMATTEMATVHHSRVIRIGGDRLSPISWLANSRWDDSILQAPYNTVKGYDGMKGAIASLLWEAKKDVISVDQLREMLADDDGEEELRRRFSAMAMAASSFNLTLLDARDKYDQKQLTYGGLDNMMKEFRSDVAGAAGVPITILFGQSPGGLNSTGESDTRGYYDRINAKQEALLRHGMWLYHEVLCRSAFGKKPEEFGFDFDPLWQMSDKEKAEVEKLRSDRDKTYWDIGSASGGLIAETLLLNRTYPPMRDKDVALVKQVEAGPEPHDPKSGTVDPTNPIDPTTEGAASDATARRAFRAIARDASQLQTFIFAKKDFTPERAAGWLKRNGKANPGPDADVDSLRYRQEDPSAFEPGSFRTISIAPGVSAVIGHPKRKNDGKDIVDRKEFQGLKVAIENPAGTLRQWKDDAGNVTRSTAMRHHYGFLEDSIGSDGEEMDVYLGPHPDADEAYGINQQKGPDYTTLDEQKWMLGFRSADEAKAAYLAHRDDGTRAYGGMSALPMARFKQKLKSRTGTGPIRV